MIKKCENCEKSFKVKPFFIKMGWGKFCSASCHHLSMRTGKIFNCNQCNKEVYRNNKQIKHSKSGEFFCSKSCQTKWRNVYFSGDKHLNWIHGESAYRGLMIKNKKLKQICNRCKNSDLRILIVHHIDRDRRNNKLSNLMWLCRNCHFLIHCDKFEEFRMMETLV